MAVNTVTNKIYVVNLVDATVTVIDGATNSTTAVPVGVTPIRVAVDEQHNKIYVANLSSDSMTVIDGATNTTTDALSTDVGPFDVAVSPVDQRVYLLNDLGSVTVFSNNPVKDDN
jgi:YVTN family beta-propeller protein